MSDYITVKQMAEKLNISLDTAYVWVHMADFPTTRAKIMCISLLRFHHLHHFFNIFTNLQPGGLEGDFGEYGEYFLINYA